MTESIITPIALDDLDPDGAVAQSRIARMALAYMTADSLMAADVSLEVNTDPRGAFIALHETVCALTAALADSWTRVVGVEEVIPVVRRTLATLEGGRDD
jgi:hypothetical protein